MWATIEETKAITAIDVTAQDLASAQNIVETLADTTEDSNGFMYSKNLRLLKNAVAWQAAWMSQHPDVFAAMEVNSATQDGLSYTSITALSGVVSPLARMNIDRLSWKRNRSVLIRKAGQRQGNIPNRLNTTNADLDDNRNWKPLY